MNETKTDWNTLLDFGVDPEIAALTKQAVQDVIRNQTLAAELLGGPVTIYRAWMRDDHTMQIVWRRDLTPPSARHP